MKEDLFLHLFFITCLLYLFCIMLLLLYHCILIILIFNYILIHANIIYIILVYTCINIVYWHIKSSQIFNSCYLLNVTLLSAILKNKQRYDFVPEKFLTNICHKRKINTFVFSEQINKIYSTLCSTKRNFPKKIKIVKWTKIVFSHLFLLTLSFQLQDWFF